MSDATPSEPSAPPSEPKQPAVPEPTKSEMAALQKPSTAAEKLDTRGMSRKGQIREALKLVPKNAIDVITGGGEEGEVDADDPETAKAAPESSPTDQAVTTPTETEKPAAEAAPTTEETPPAEGTTTETAPEPADAKEKDVWAKFAALEESLLEQKKANKRLADQLTEARNQAPAATPGGVTADEFRQDPQGALKKLGISSLAELGERVAEGAPTADYALSEVEKVKKEFPAQVQDIVRKAIEEARTEDRVKMGIQRAIYDNPKMKLLQSDVGSATAQALDEMTSYFRDTGEILPIEQACAKVHGRWADHLRKLDAHKAASEILGLSTNGAAAPQSAPAVQEKAPEPTPPASAPPQAQTPSETQTLTNDMHSSSPPKEVEDNPGLPPAMARRQMIKRTVKQLVPEGSWSEDLDL